MNKETKAKAEEYQAFLLRRYGLEKLSQSDPGSAGKGLMAQLDVNAGKMEPLY